MDIVSWSGTSPDHVLNVVLDEELEQYRLLAYLQRVDAAYAARKLYPCLDELRSRLQQLLLVRQRCEQLAAALPTHLIGIDPYRLELVRAPVENGIIKAVDTSLELALPAMENALERGSELRQELRERIHFTPVGLVPLFTREGYLLLRQGGDALVYSYAIPVLRESDDDLQYRSLHTTYVTSYSVGFAWNYAHIKADLIRNRQQLPNPATFVFESDISLPRIETFMPLAKQLIYKHVGPLIG